MCAPGFLLPTGPPSAHAQMEVQASSRSLAISRDWLYDGAAVLAPRLLRQLCHGEDARTTGPSGTAKPGDEPGNLESIALAARIGLSWLRHRLPLPRDGWWFLAMRQRDEATGAMTAFRALPAERGHFYADPFLIEKDGKTHLFFEDFDQQTKRGRIGHAVLDGDGMPSRAAPALRNSPQEASRNLHCASSN